MSSLIKQFGCILLLALANASLAHADRKTTYYHSDSLGTVVAASNETGALLWRKEYAPFGAQIDTVADNERLAYTGKPHDDEIGLTYFGARYYDPLIGRFMSTDPVRFNEANPMSFNRYAYVNNNPYRFVDPDGLEKIEPQEARKKYSVGKGHHWVPFGTFGPKEDISVAAREIFGQAVSGDDLPSEVHQWDRDHVRYNAAVRAEFDDYIHTNKIDPSKMTAEQARRFVKRVKSSSHLDINILVKRIDAFMSLPAGSRKLFRAMSTVGFGYMVEANMPSPPKAPICNTAANVDGC